VCNNIENIIMCNGPMCVCNMCGNEILWLPCILLLLLMCVILIILANDYYYY